MSLRDRLQIAGIAQTDLARAAGVTQPAVCRMLNGDRPVSPKVRAAAERLLANRPAELMRAAADLLSAKITEGGEAP